MTKMNYPFKRKQSLTMNQFNKSKKGTSKQIENVLRLFRMETSYRYELNRIMLSKTK